MEERVPELADLEALWSPGHDPVETFAASIEMALRDLRAEVASLRTERDELRHEAETLRLRLDAASPRPVAAVSVPVVEEPFRIAWDVPTAVPARRRQRRRLSRLAAYVAGGLPLLIVLAVTVGPLVLPYRTYHVRSGSMAPGIPTGALVVLTEIDAEDVVVGDVITFDRPDGSGERSVTHRVVDVEETDDGRAFVTKGDANPSPDPWLVPAGGTQWRYAFDVPVAGTVFGWLSTTAARVALVVAAAATVVWLWWSDRRRSATRA